MVCSSIAFADGRVVSREGYVRLIVDKSMREWPEPEDHVVAGAWVDAEKDSSLRASFGASSVHVGARSKLQWLSDGEFKLEKGSVCVRAESGSPAVLQIGPEKISISSAHVVALDLSTILVLSGQAIVQGQTVVAGQRIPLAAGSKPAPILEADLARVLAFAADSSERKAILQFAAAADAHVPAIKLESDQAAYEKHIGD